VRRVPTPARAEELMREHGVPGEAELLATASRPCLRKLAEEEERHSKRALSLASRPLEVCTYLKRRWKRRVRKERRPRVLHA
jgi:hypothetical protein